MTMLCTVPAIADISEENYAANLFGGLLVDHSDAILSSVIHEDKILVLTRKAFYVYQCGNDTAQYLSKANNVQQKYPDDRVAVDVLFAENEKIMGLNSMTGHVYQLDLGSDSIAFTPVIELEWDSFQMGEPPYEYVPVPEYAFVSMGQLYVKFPNDSKQTDLYQFDLATGKVTACNVAFLQGLCPYKEGTFLAARFDVEHSETGYPEIVAFNPMTNEIESTDYIFPEEILLGQIPMVYSHTLNRLYVASSTKLYALEQGNAPVVVERFVPFGDELSSVISPMLSLSPQGTLVLTVGSNVYLRDIAASQQKQMVTLTIAGRLPDQTAAAKALLELGNVNLQEIGSEDPLALQTSLLTGTSQADILVLDSSIFDILGMIKKGYAKPFTQSQTLSDFSHALLPELQGISIYNNELQTIPLSISMRMPAMNANAFQELGITPPDTFAQLLALIQTYVSEIYPSHNEYKLFPFAFIKQHLKKYACTLYLETKFLEGGCFTIDPIELGQLLESIDSINLDALEIPEDINPDDEMFYMTDTDSSSIALMQLDSKYCLSEKYSEAYYSAMPLSLKDEGNCAIYAVSDFAMLSASSTNEKLATLFLEAYIKYMDKGTAAMLCPFSAKPVEDASFEQQLQEQAEQIKINQQLAEKTDAPDKYLYQEMADHFQDNLNVLQSRGKWSITENDLRQNRAIMEQVHLDTSNTISIRTALFTDSNLINSLLEGSITVEQFAEEANRIAEMILFRSIII